MRVEKGSGLTPHHSRTRPADILALDWDRGRHAAFDVTVTSPSSVFILPETSMSVGAAALEAEVRKHRANDPKRSELGWVCVPLAVETNGNWGKEAQATFSHRLDNHAATCKRRGDVFSHHNRLRDLGLEFCRRAYQVDAWSYGLTDHSPTSISPLSSGQLQYYLPLALYHIYSMQAQPVLCPLKCFTCVNLFRVLFSFLTYSISYLLRYNA